jgi:hypothetical protein
VRDRLTVPFDAAATASNIVAHASLLRFGIVTVLLNAAQDAIGGMNALDTYRPLQLLGTGTAPTRSPIPSCCSGGRLRTSR